MHSVLLATQLREVYSACKRYMKLVVGEEGTKYLGSRLQMYLLSGGRGPVGNLAVLRLCLTRTDIHHMKITPTATSSTTDRLTAMATMYSVLRRGLPLLDCTPGVIE